MIALLAACVTGPGDELGLPNADPEVFEDQVLPVLAAGCANPSCHGTAGRPLSVYAEGRYRMDPSLVYSDEPLTDDEVERDYLSAASFLVDIDEPEESELLSKPLSEEYGGSRHVGGVQFADPWEPDYVVLLDWVSAALEEEPR